MSNIQQKTAAFVVRTARVAAVSIFVAAMGAVAASQGAAAQPADARAAAQGWRQDRDYAPMEQPGVTFGPGAEYVGDGCDLPSTGCPNDMRIAN